MWSMQIKIWWKKKIFKCNACIRRNWKSAKDIVRIQLVIHNPTLFHTQVFYTFDTFFKLNFFDIFFNIKGSALLLYCHFSSLYRVK